MIQGLLTSFYFCLPVIVGGVLHMLAVKFNLWPFLVVSIHQGLFGENKTVRGFVVMPIATVIGVFAVSNLNEPLFSNVNRVVLGVCLGLAYVLFELPNSYIKRRLGVKPGYVPQKNRWFFLLLDHSDSLIGCMLVYWWFFPDNLLSVALIAVTGPMAHFAVNGTLYMLGVRRAPL
jgi:hypothetical protein